MKRLITISLLAFLTLTTGVASATVLKPMASEGDWGSSPIFATSPPDDGRLFVAERGDGTQARIRVFKDGVLQSTPFLTIPNVNTDVERGLLSFAFSPDYATNGLFYVFYNAGGPDTLDPSGVAGDIRIVEYRVSSSNPDVANPASARLVLKQPHPAGNHNGGWMAFGPDGDLYFTIGDDADSSNAQDLGVLFGKLSRINPADPDGAGPETYTIPSDNPFVHTAGARGEIWTEGLRNPFRDSFSPDGRLVVADVGNNTTEEVDVGDLKGKNLGWPTCEGRCTTPNPLLTDPFFTYNHQPDGNCAILGGYVIRDPDLTGLTGRYVYGDLCKTDLRTLNLSSAGPDPQEAAVSIPNTDSLRSFGEDSRGCTYVMTDNNVYRIAASASSPTACPHSAQVPPPPPPPVDTTKPTVKLSTRAHYLGHHIQFQARSDEACVFKTTGALKAKRHGKKKAFSFRYTAKTVNLDANATTSIHLSIKGKALRHARRVSRSGRKLRAVMTAVATDTSGNSRTIHFHINIRRKHPLK